jgi:ABC-type polysaccharide/polyol phosphate export permease
MYETVLQDARPVAWENVLGKPLLFPPTTHLHNLEDVYGFEPIVGALERVRNAIILSDVPAFEALVDWVNGQISGTRTTRH